MVIGNDFAIPTGNEFLVNTYTNSDQYAPSITALADGGFVVTWASYGQDGSGYGIYGQRYDSSGATVGAEFQINTYSNDNQFVPSVTALADGGFVVTWASNGQDGLYHGIYGQRYDSSGATVGAEFQINTYSNSDQYAPSITALADGGFVVTWASYGQDGSGYGIYGQRYDSSGATVGAEFQINTYTNAYQYRPSITSLADGGFVVSWASTGGQDGSDHGIYGQRYDSSGATVGAEFQINTYTTNDQGGPSVTALSDGGFVVTWTSFDQDGSGGGIYGQRYDSSGATAGAEFQINTYTNDNQFEPSVTALADGGFVVTWESWYQDGSGASIYGQRYDSSGGVVGAEFQINTYATSYQEASSVAALSDGGFVVTWQSMGQDGSEFGIYAQIFDVDGTPVPELETAQEIFDAEGGQLSFFSQLALAAYSLMPREVEAPLVNDRNATADVAFGGGSLIDGTEYTPIRNHLKLLGHIDLRGGLKLSEPDGSDFPQNGLKNGIYTNENAAALVGRSADALFLTFRGTNDAKFATGGPLAEDTPDKDHWVGKGDHYDLFRPLINAITKYVNEASNEILTIYISGHSLGASMVEALLEEWSMTNVVAVAFASPGYGIGDGHSESRLTNFWIAKDPILGASWAFDNDGDKNKIFHNLDKTSDVSKVSSNVVYKDDLHSMKLYSAYMKFFNDEGVDLEALHDLNGVNYSRIYAYIEVSAFGVNAYTIGTLADDIEGTRKAEILLGGKKSDTLTGKGGKDYLDGGTQNDKLYGGGGSDHLTGGKGKDLLWGEGGKDTFVFRNHLETNSSQGVIHADRIKDFDVGIYSDTIDLSGIDAMSGVKGNQEFDFIGTDAFTGTKGQLRYSQNANNTIIRGDRDGDGFADFAIVVEGLHDLQENDFIL